MNKYVEYKNREEWLSAREKSLGASETASAIGRGFSSPIDVWKEKTGKTEKKDLSDNERVAYGIEAEAYLRALFALQFKDKYSMEYYPFRVYRHEKFEFLTATLDGELVRRANNKRGIWECKTAWIMSKADLERWNDDSIPQHYYVQVCEQLNVTGFDFVVLTAQLIFMNGNAEIRHYTIERAEAQEDIEYIETEAKKFWRFVEMKKQPPQKFTL